MTPREPDRFVEQARALQHAPVLTIAAALRQAADDALERAAQGCADGARRSATSAAGARATGEHEEAGYFDERTSTWRNAESLCRAMKEPAAALAAPGDGEKKAPEAECAGCRYGFSIGMDGRHWYTGGTGSNVSMDCAKRPRKP